MAVVCHGRSLISDVLLFRKTWKKKPEQHKTITRFIFVYLWFFLQYFSLTFCWKFFVDFALNCSVGFSSFFITYSYTHTDICKWWNERRADGKTTAFYNHQHWLVQNSYTIICEQENPSAKMRWKYEWAMGTKTCSTNTEIIKSFKRNDKKRKEKKIYRKLHFYFHFYGHSAHLCWAFLSLSLAGYSLVCTGTFGSVSNIFINTFIIIAAHKLPSKMRHSRNAVINSDKWNDNWSLSQLSFGSQRPCKISSLCFSPLTLHLVAMKKAKLKFGWFFS